ncbi:hypothetical protein RD792_004395 [Penstemon davidsonii]|uniref:RING-type E3 ubiquitin transferase n=1 Tax=Penstemon davidsonii TaxID=160366 RepID=A0ABR0DHA2_9LAMI|nr:hypothetical protein RD792_004395 [Penstemon davidsonii]
MCTFYQKGSCSYGSRCRYDHVKVSQSLAPTPSPSVYRPFPVGSVSGTTASNVPFHPPIRPAWGETSEHHVVLETDEDADQSICSFAAAGDCPRGEKCPHIHGDLCPSCGKHCLHPFRPEEREEHIKTCEKRQKHLVALRHSQEIECSVCLECVLSKPTPAERKFGILSECDHPFCISCIRNWRSSSPASGLDVNSALRACPICRKLSYFVIPSVIWSIDCRNFDFGNGTCPFGTSCFYKHAYRDGRLEEVALRHLGAEDGNTVIAKNIRLSDFLSNLRI